VQTVVRRISCEVTTKVDMSKMAQNYSLHENDTAQTVPLDIKNLCRVLYNVNKVRVLQFYREKFVAPTSTFLHGVKRHCGHPISKYSIRICIQVTFKYKHWIDRLQSPSYYIPLPSSNGATLKAFWVVHRGSARTTNHKHASHRHASIQVAHPSLAKYIYVIHDIRQAWST